MYNVMQCFIFNYVFLILFVDFVCNSAIKRRDESFIWNKSFFNEWINEYKKPAS